MEKKQTIAVTIADQPPFEVLATPAEASLTRDAESAVNSLWRSWSAKYPYKKPSEVLAMVAYRYAQFYMMEREASARASQMLEQFEADLDQMLA